MERAVADTSLLLTLGHASALELIWNDVRRTWHVTPIARGEVQSEPTRSAISRALVEGNIASTELDTDSAAELKALGAWTDLVDPGEAEAIAIALTRGWVVGLEDLYAQRQLTRRVGAETWINSATLLIEAVRDQRMDPVTGDAIFTRLDCYDGYRKRGHASLADLMR